jgi:hypothetical protein
MKEVRPTGLVPDETIWRLVDMLADPSAISAADAKEFHVKKREPPATYLYDALHCYTVALLLSPAYSSIDLAYHSRVFCVLIDLRHRGLKTIQVSYIG